MDIPPKHRIIERIITTFLVFVKIKKVNEFIDLQTSNVTGFGCI
jgi:hypothetical protein